MLKDRKKSLLLIGLLFLILPHALFSLNSILFSCTNGYKFWPAILGFFDGMIKWLANLAGFSFLILTSVGLVCVVTYYVLDRKSSGIGGVRLLVEGLVFSIVFVWLYVIVSALVLPNNARNSSPDASIRQSLNSIRSQAELHYITNDFSYGGVCSTDKVLDLLSAVRQGDMIPLNQGLLCAEKEINNKEVSCRDNDKEYVVYSYLPSNGYWCIDGTGRSKYLEQPPVGMYCQ
ncbi:MAG: hypothetical protein R3B53_04615 [Candidatus Paceibacterota bacterium]